MGTAQEVFCHTLLSQLCMRPVDKDKKMKNGIGFTFEPDPKHGVGFFWTYPINAACSIYICDLQYHEACRHHLYHPDVILISMNLPEAIFNSQDSITESDGTYHPLGVFMDKDESCFSMTPGMHISNITISMRPSFFSRFLQGFFDRDGDEIIEAICSLDGTISLPEVEQLLVDIVKSTPNLRTAPIRYEAKIFDILAGIFEWYFSDKPGYSVDGVSEHDREVLQNLHHFLQQNFTAQLELEKLSKMCGMSRSKLTQLYRVLYDTTAYDFVLNCRVEYAKELIEKTDKKIGEIALLAGYPHQSSLTVAFQHKYGLSPKDYKRQLMKF